MTYFQEADNEGYLISGNYNTSGKRIFLMGDSTIENIFVAPDSRVNYTLEKEILKNNYNYSVLNTAISGETILHIFNVIINKIARFKNSTIVLTIPSNDFYALQMKQSYWNGHKDFGNIIPVNYDEEKNNLIDINLKHQIAMLNSIKEFCKVFEIKLLISGIIYNDEKNDFKKINELVKNWCLKKSVPYLPLSELLSQKDELFYDDLHFNNYGAKIAGKELFKLAAPYLNNEEVTFNQFIIGENFELNNKTYWSNYIDITENSILSLWIDTKVNKKVSYNSALYVVEYDRDVSHEECGLTKSGIGLYEYLKLQDDGLDACQHLKIQIPINVKKLRVGIRKWQKDAQIFLNKAFLNKIN